jgi:hypothetical protein
MNDAQKDCCVNEGIGGFLTDFRGMASGVRVLPLQRAITIANKPCQDKLA